MASSLGRQAEMYYGTAGSSASTLLGIVENNTTKVENNAVEGNFRSSRQTNHRAGQQKITGTVVVEREVANAGYTALKNAADNGTTVALKFIPVNGNSSDVIDGDFMVSNFTNEEPIDGWQKTTFDYALNIDSRAGSIT